MSADMLQPVLVHQRDVQVENPVNNPGSGVPRRRNVNEKDESRRDQPWKAIEKGIEESDVEGLAETLDALSPSDTTEGGATPARWENNERTAPQETG